MVVDLRSWGIEAGYHDAAGRWCQPPVSTLESICSTMGALDGAHPDHDPRVVTVRLDHPLPHVGAGELRLEGGGVVDIDGTLPPDLPTGYHRLAPRGGAEPLLFIVSPGRCPWPKTPQWGFAAQLYATRSRHSWGMGDLADLGRLGRWSAELGAGLVLLNPLHAAPPGEHQEPSPYFASSRCFSSPLYLRVEDVPGASALPDLDRLVADGRSLNTERLIDRTRVWALKSKALEAIFDAYGGDADFDSYRSDRGHLLQAYATWCALAEVHGLPWSQWPAAYRRPDAPAVRSFAESPPGAKRVTFHAWLQWQIDRQLAAATGAGAGLMQDLAIGVNPGGADSWIWQDAFAGGMRVGAPPDEFNTKGQDWGLPPFDPWKLRSAAYLPFIETVRSGMRHGAGLRFDHVMGLFRLFWIPEGSGPESGTYVHYPYWDLLNILSLEAERAGAYVVGEDLGTVEEHVRPELAERRVLSYRLLWFESTPPARWPEQALGAVSTHDLPTVAGVWDGTDLAAQRDLDLSPNEEGAAAMRSRLVEVTGARPDATAAEVVASAYSALGEAPCLLLTASLDDVAVVEERPNMPGTIEERPNWSLALPLPLEEIEVLPLAERLAASLRRGGEGPPKET